MNFFDLQPGTQADWVAAVGTGLAFLIAAISYARSVARARKAQARRVYAHVDDVRTKAVGDNSHIWSLMMEGKANLEVTDSSLVKASPNLSHYDYLKPAAIFTVKIHNGSDEIMGPIRVELVDELTQKLLPEGATAVQRIEPGDSAYRVQILADSWMPVHPPVSVRIVFRDSSGKWWHRFGSEPVKAAAYTTIDSRSPSEQLASELRSKRA